MSYGKGWGAKWILAVAMVLSMILTNEGLADFIFGEPLNLGRGVNTTGYEGQPCMSPDGLELYFRIVDETRGSELMVSRRQKVTDDWERPENLGPTINSAKHDWAPHISADGLELYFTSRRPGGDVRGRDDIWVSRRDSLDSEWGTPINLGPNINTDNWDTTPFLSRDGLTLYFTSGRYNEFHQWETTDLYVAHRETVEAPWQPSENMGPVINEYSWEYFPATSPNGLVLFFSSDRASGLGGFDIWMATRPTANSDWGIPANPGPGANTLTFDGSISLSRDGRTLLFTSDREGGFGCSDLWQIPILPKVDFNGDGTADARDMSVLFEHWHQDEPLCDIGPTPFGDGTVDVHDWMVFSEQIEGYRGPHQGAVDIRPDIVLHWTPMPFTRTCDIYMGTSQDDVSGAERGDPRGVLVSQGQTASTYDPEGLLQFGKTYYWRLDEVTAPPESIVHRGVVCSFTVEEYAYPVESVGASASAAVRGSPIENTINGSGLNRHGQHTTAAEDMWRADVGDEPVWIVYEFDRVYRLHEMHIWNSNVLFELVLGIGLKDVTMDYSVDGDTWMTLGNVEFAQATAQSTYTHNTTIDLDGLAAKYVRLTVNECWDTRGGQCGLSEVRFTYIPARAYEPSPKDGATDVSTVPMLAWRSGRQSAVHEVHMDADRDSLANGTSLAESCLDPQYLPNLLDLGQTYYWRVDEVNEAEAIGLWEGDIWSFSSAEYLLVEDFEHYNDDVDNGETIYQAWIDGYINDTGATAGHTVAPFAEIRMVKEGLQSMPLAYDNSKEPFYSEASRIFDPPQDWTVAGADTFALWISGNAPSLHISPTGHMIMNGQGSEIWEEADEFRFTYKRLSGDGSIVVRVDSIGTGHGWASAGVMVRESLAADSRYTFVAATPAHGVAFQRRASTGGSSDDVSEVGLTVPYWVKLTRAGNKCTAEHSKDGINWSRINDDPEDSTMTVSMPTDVFIGLALCSYNADVPVGAEFSNVVVTGDVTEDWETTGIGAEQPEGNEAEPVYVVIEDDTGRAATFTHPDALVALRPAWHQWRISYRELTDIDLTRVKKLHIGLGNREHPSQGGAGVIYIDGIGFGHPIISE